MSARNTLLDLFLTGGPGSQPEFEAALDTHRAEVLREAAEGVQSGDVAFDTATAEAVARNADPMALIAYAQLVTADHLRRKADEAVKERS